MERSSKEKTPSPISDVSKKEGEAAWWQPSLILFSRLSGWIGGPIIIALFVGKWLDERYDKEPWLFLFSIGIAFTASSIGIVREAQRAMEEIAREGEEKAKSQGENKNPDSKEKN